MKQRLQTLQNLKSLHADGSFALGNLDHPNKMPFSGILTFFDVPSNRAVGGAMGKKVMIPSQFGIPSLSSLQGMAVDFDAIMMNKHVATHKIGIIEKAWAGDMLQDGSTPVHVSGYVFAHDFPAEASDIKEFQSDLGFSYETIDTPVINRKYKGEDILVVSGEVVFSGAAILKANSAAYTSTSLAASNSETDEMEVPDLSIEEILEKVITALETKYTLTAKADEVVEEPVENVPVVEETVVEPEVAPEVKPVLETEGPAVEQTDEPVVKLEPVAPIEPVVEEIVQPVEAVDFQAMALNLQVTMEAMQKELVDLKAEKDEVIKNTHKGFAYPTTLAAKFNFEANADSYEAQIAAIDARTDLEPNEAMALKWEIRAKALKK